MAHDELDTVYLHKQYQRIQEGDALALDDLIRRAQHRLEKLTRKMLRSYPGVERWEDPGDVMQNAMIRLLRALKSVQPENVRAFFGLAAEMVRRELIDLARHYRGTYGLGANYSSVMVDGANNSEIGERQIQPEAAKAEDLDRWLAFHEAVEKLPVEEREVFGLKYYHGWTQDQIAELFEKDERTIRRWWQSACTLLRERLGTAAPS